MNPTVSDAAIDVLTDFASRLEAAAGRDDDLEAWLLRVAAAELPGLAVRIARDALPNSDEVQPHHAQMATQLMGGIVLPLLCRAVDLAREAAALSTNQATAN